MDDHTRTRKVLDDLAELYLTGVHSSDQPTTPPSSNNNPQPKAPRWPKQANTTTVRQPPPGPKLAITHPANHERDADDQTQDRRSKTQAPAAGPPPLVEAVFLGNLPGFSGPWLTQYAHYQAKHHGVIVVLSVDRDGVDVELVAPQGQSLNGLVERYTKSTHGSDSLARALKFLTDDETITVGGWLVHFSTPIGLDARCHAQHINRWTLVCGADDAAVVGAYRLLKQLNAPAGRDITNEPATHTPRRVGVMVMGSDDSSGRGAAMKLNHTAGSFLGTPVELVGCQKQMQPVNAQPLGYFTGGGEEHLWSLIHAFLETVGTDPSKPPVDDTSPRPLRVDQPVGTAPAAEERNTFNDKCNEPADVDTPAQARPDLSTFMPDGFALLEARCPHDPEAQLMLDRDGRVHVLMRTDGNGTAPMDRALDTTLAHLLATGSWVRQHLALLKLTRPEDRFDEQADPVLHLFTDQPKAATALVSRLESLVKVHLLQQVHVRGSSTWHGCELN